MRAATFSLLPHPWLPARWETKHAASQRLNSFTPPPHTPLTPKLPPLQEITMDSREVNEIVVKLLAAADKIGDREILHLVGRLSRVAGRLSRAATRERSTAFDEMHHLDRKIRQLQDEVKRLDPHNPLLRRSPTSHARSRPMVSIHYLLSMAGNTVANHAATGRSL